MFVGWGSEPYFSEFSASGQLLFDAHMHGSDQSYRAYRFPWTGTPAGAPAIAAAAAAANGPTTVYASWNGATEVASWRVLAGASPPSSRRSPAPPRRFETAIATPAPAPYVAVQALDASGAVLGTSPAISPSAPTAAVPRFTAVPATHAERADSRRPPSTAVPATHAERPTAAVNHAERAHPRARCNRSWNRSLRSCRRTPGLILSSGSMSNRGFRRQGCLLEALQPNQLVKPEPGKPEPRAKALPRPNNDAAARRTRARTRDRAWTETMGRGSRSRSGSGGSGATGACRPARTAWTPRRCGATSANGCKRR